MNPCAQYSLRWNAEGDDGTPKEAVLAFMKALGKQWVFQKERGDSGYVHWQGVISLNKKRRKDELIRLCNAEGLKLANYCEPVVSTLRGDTFYVTKLDTRIEGPFKDTDDDEELYVPRQFRDITFHPWQEGIAETRNDFNSRWVNALIDRPGGKGKSTCAHVCRLRYKAVVIPVVNDAEKLRSSVCDILMAKNLRTPGLMFLNIPRAFDQTKMSGMMSAIEEIKDGYVYDMRYSFKDWDFDSPSVWVFMNQMPDVSNLSRDRWRFWRINDALNTLERFEYNPPA